jgi:hypothetical protein
MRGEAKQKIKQDTKGDIMTEQEFQILCSKTPPGTTLTFSFRDQEVRGKFIGCAENAVVIEANGRGYFWPRDLCSYQESSYGIPSYS